MNLVDVLREFGFPVAMVILFSGVIIWIVKVSINHFLTAIKEASEERRAMTDKFTLVVENHISHNTEALNSVCETMKGLSQDHKDFNVQLAKAVRE